MKIILLEANESCARPPLQTWNNPTPPDGYAFCPDDFVDVFYSTTPAGFVTITVEDGIVTAMEVNQEALDAYIVSMPQEEKTEESEFDYDAFLLDLDYRVMCIENGLTE